MPIARPSPVHALARPAVRRAAFGTLAAAFAAYAVAVAAGVGASAPATALYSALLFSGALVCLARVADLDGFKRYNDTFGHHERYDDAGYPDALAGEAISVAARIVAVCDAYDAMISDRSYRRGMSSEAAVEELRRSAGSQFDPRIVETFCAVLAEQVSADRRLAA